MRLSELIVAINSLKWDIEQWKIEKENEQRVTVVGRRLEPSTLAR